jgi:hypothetical protein
VFVGGMVVSVGSVVCVTVGSSVDVNVGVDVDGPGVKVAVKEAVGTNVFVGDGGGVIVEVGVLVAGGSGVRSGAKLTANTPIQ